MVKLCNPKLRLYKGDHLESNDLSENYLNSEIDFITYYIDIDPFLIEYNIINLQYYWEK